ncbi:hypothetical protein EVA_20947 [gut metagenome]|uniref:Uncharacterized protein n=1 Tax=gut metagenome TaxID=749906 RepID=J9F7R6_9ZZZZ
MYKKLEKFVSTFPFILLFLSSHPPRRRTLSLPILPLFND